MIKQKGSVSLNGFSVPERRYTHKILQIKTNQVLRLTRHLCQKCYIETRCKWYTKFNIQAFLLLKF